MVLVNVMKRGFPASGLSDGEDSSGTSQQGSCNRLVSTGVDEFTGADIGLISENAIDVFRDLNPLMTMAILE